MGIPRFFYWLYKEYPFVLTKLQHKETFLKYKINVDTYALDLNAIVHPICQQVFGYGQYKDGQINGNIKRLMHNKVKVEYPCKRIECYNKICDKIDELVNIVNPTSKLILALDGTAGMSKQYQQRQRRYRAVIDNPITDKTNTKKEFDSNEITTGSVFMNELSQCIHEYISHKIKNEWKDIDIYFSSEQVPGEGEHKIMHMLKQYSSFGSYCIHSPDADLIMLSLASLSTHEFKKCYIMRDNIYQHVYCKYFIVDVDLFSDIIINKFKMYSTSHSKKQHYLSDFILYCFFFGNDFLPENPLMLTDKNGIDILFLLYSETLVNYGNLTKICKDKVTLNLDECIYYFEQLSNNEEILYKKKYPNNTLNIDDFKKDYYKNKLEFNTEDPLQLDKQINKLCNEYMKGVQFILTYYLYDIPDWYWFYPYHYAPFFSDICKYLKSIKLKRMTSNNTSNTNNILSYKFDKNEPLTPFEQLLAVLPPESAEILPQPFSDLMTSSTSKIKSFYPETDSIKVEIKSEYEKTILVPFINVHLLRDTFRNVSDVNKNKLSDVTMRRNMFINNKNYINSTKLKL
jgi:5'-3' exonuclease